MIQGYTVIRCPVLPILLSILYVGNHAAGVAAQLVEEASGNGVRYGETLTQKYQAGIIVTATGGACRKLFGTATVPRDWPEQKVRIVDEDFSTTIRKTGYRMTDGVVKQLLIRIPYLVPGEEAKALVTFEVQRRVILPPVDPSILTVPKKPPRNVKKFLGPSPLIQSRHPSIRSLAKSITADQDVGWAKAEAIFDYVRDNIEYKDGPIKGALRALRDKTGDCEELTSLIVALCRASRIPARTVWVPGHCYAEFYLEDDQRKGHWFPCDAAADERIFGEIEDSRPILQKGDNFRVPEKKERQRYVGEFLRGLPASKGAKPQFRAVRHLVSE